MRNMIDHWAHLIDESYVHNPDDHKSDRMDADSEKWEEMQRELAEINRKLDHKGLKEAEDDDEELGEPFDDDPEFQSLMRKADAGIAQRKKASDRNERLANGERNSEDDEYDRLSGDEKKMASSSKMFFVYEVVDEYEPGNSKADIEKVRDLDDVAKLKTGKTLVNKIATEVFPTEDEAKEYIRKEMGKYSQKYGITAEDFKKLHEKVEIKHSMTTNDQNSGKKVTKRSKVEVGAIPKSILQADPNAFGYLYASSDIDGDGKVYGVDKGGMFTSDDEDERGTELLMEFICYKSFYPAPATGGMLELHDALRRIDDPNYRTADEIRKQKEREHDEMISELENEMFETTADYIERFIAKEDDEVILSVLKPYFKEMKDDDILNLTAEDMKKLGKQKVFNVRNGIWRYQDKEDLEDYANSLKVDVNKDDKDDEAANAEKTDKSYSNRSIDGYATRSDDDNAKDDDSDDEVEKDDDSGSVDSRKDDDMDDYEGSQNVTGVRYGDTGGSAKKHSNLTLHGVKISQKVFDAWKGLKQEDRPKNAEEVKAFIKKVNDRDR